MINVFLTVGQEVLDEGIDSDQAEWIIIGLIALCAVAIIVVLRFFQKLATRVALTVVLLGLIGGLWVQREALEDCAGQCECRLFGQDVRVPDPQDVCG